MTEYVANTRIKTGTWKSEGGETFIEPGEPVDDTVGDLDQLLEAGAIVDKEDYVEPEENKVYNQASGTPSNLPQVEGTELQVNLPDAPEDSAPPTPVPVNPADPPKVAGAVNPGDGSDSHGQDVDEAEDGESV